MSFTIYDASVPVFVHSMASIPAWLDKALAEGKSEAAILESRLAPDMRPFPAQIQMASDSAKNAVARLMVDAPPSQDPDSPHKIPQLVPDDRARAKNAVFVAPLAKSRIG